MTLQKVEHDMEASGSIMVQRQSVTRVWMEGDLDSCSVWVSGLKIRHVGKSLAVSPADVEVVLGQEVLQGSLERWSIIPDDPEG